MSKPAPVKLAYQVFDPVSGVDHSFSPIIFLHGLTGTKEHWMDIPQVVADKSRRKVYAIDARNHGDTAYTEDFSFDLNVDDLFHFMDTIDAQKAVLVGHSMGGITSMRAALRNPKRVEVVFCEDMYARKLAKEALDAINEYIRLWTKTVEKIPKDMSPAEALTFSIDYICNHLAKNVPYYNEEKMREVPMKLNRSPEGVYSSSFNYEVISRALKNRDTLMAETSCQFDGPAYFIYGSLSPFAVEKEEENIKKHFPRAKLIKFEGATHSLHFEFKEKFIEAVLHYLNIESENPSKSH